MKGYWKLFLFILAFVIKTNGISAQKEIKEKYFPMDRELEKKIKLYEKEGDLTTLIFEYETPSSTDGKDVFITPLFNGEELDSSMLCGDVNRVRSKKGKKFIIEINRGKLEHSISTVGLRIAEIHIKRPHVQKWALSSVFRPHWGHKQLAKKNNGDEDKPEVNETIKSLKENEPKIKGKTRLIAPIMVTLLSGAILSELTSRVEYRMYGEKRTDGEIITGQKNYKRANGLRRAALVLTGTAIVLNIGNAINVLGKGNKKLRNYKRNYRTGRKCPKS